MDKYTRGKVLGKGSFGCAVLCTNKLDGKNVVIKEVDMSRMPKAERDAAEQEARLLMALNHPNIVRCSECFTHQNKLCIVMDWCSEGDIYCILQKKKGVPLSEETIIDWFVQMCLGLKHVHDRKILHRDIKTQNVFMSAGGLLKLGDFGVSKILNSTFQLATTAVGTPYYLSPEICANKRYNQKSDIWSLGCVLYEITTQKHAFEAPNMRALIQKIIKGSYTPLPSSRSKDLRDLIANMLTLDWQKRPSINDVLAAPICKARITKFLSATLHANEFSHTIIHGKPQKGQLVVGADTSGSSAASSAPSGPHGKVAAPGFFASPPAGVKAAGAVAVVATAAARAGQPAQAQRVVPAAAAAAGRPPAGAGGPGAAYGRPASPKASPAGKPAVPVSRPESAGAKRPSSNGNGNAGHAGGAPPSPQPSAAQAQAQRVAEAKAAQQYKLQAVQKEREEAALAVAAADLARAKKAHEVVNSDQARRNAAVAATREVERMKLEDNFKKLELEKAKMEGDRRKVEGKRVEDDRKAREAEALKGQQAAGVARKAREDEARKAAADAEARKKDGEKALREREREEARQKMAAQRNAYNAVPAGAKMVVPEVRVAQPAGGVRKQWEPTVVDAVTPDVKWESPARPSDAGPTAEQRRAAWDEQQAAVARNKNQGRNGDGGLAAFLGAPPANHNRGRSPEPQRQATPPHAEPSAEQRRAAYQELQDAAKRNRAAVEGRPVSATKSSAGAAPRSPEPQARRHTGPGLGAQDQDNPYDRKRKKLEEDRQRREKEILEYQRQHWQEMKAAADRNRRNIVADARGEAPPRTPSPQPVPHGTARKAGIGLRSTSPVPSAAGAAASAREAASKPSPPGAGERRRSSHTGAAAKQEAEEDFEFAAMVKDMQDVLGGGHHGAAHGQDDEDDDDYNDDQHAAALAGQFMLNGEVVPLPVRASDSLGAKVEALRCYLEAKLGTGPFLKVYRRLESLTPEDDEAEVSRDFMKILGAEKLPYLQLVHQLIVCEENMQA